MSQKYGTCPIYINKNIINGLFLSLTIKLISLKLMVGHLFLDSALNTVLMLKKWE